MVDIDYDLIPLEADKTEEVARNARILARSGKVPPISPASYGRVVVVNPDENFTIHHVPDDLRKPLRRAMLPVHEGGKPIPADALVRRIVEGSDETLHLLVLELHSEFPALYEFLDRLPDILRHYPECRFVLHAELTRVSTLLRNLLQDPANSCELRFHAFDGAITLSGEGSLDGMVVELPRYPTFTVPFFESLRVRVGSRSMWFTPATLKRLYHQYGVGNIEELDLSGKLRERLTTVDIPLSAIEAVRFAVDKGETFHGMRFEEEKVFATQFKERGLDSREVPFDRIEAFYRRMPEREEEEILLENVRAMRVNCFDGHVSFLWKPSKRFIPLYEITAMRIFSEGSGEGAAEDPGGGAAEIEVNLAFDAVAVIERGRPRFGDVRAGIRQIYLERLYSETLFKQAKLKAHASQLKIACLGSLSAQTFKLLKPLGLSRSLPVDRHYYLCEHIDQVPQYHQFEARLEEEQHKLQDTLKSLFAEGTDPAFDPDHVNHRLPIVLDWAHSDPKPFRETTAEHLNSIHNELRVFIKFSEAEFRRVDHPGMDYDSYFEKLSLCRTASLQAKELANITGGAYGRIFGAGETPDFVFFASQEEAETNDQSYFLPGLAWSAVFDSAGNGGLPWEGDYGFTVFLDEQLAIIESLWRQDYDEHPGAQFYDSYLKSRMEEAQRELDELQQMAEEGLPEDSQAYKQAYRRLEEEHKAELNQFQQELELQNGRLQKAEERYFAALGRFSDAMGLAEVAPESLVDSDDYIAAMDAVIADRSKEILIRLKQAIARLVRQVNVELEESRRNLKAYVETYIKVREGFIPLQVARTRKGIIVRAEGQTDALLQRLNELQRTPMDRVEEVRQNLHSRRVVLKEETAGLERELEQIAANSRVEVAAVRDRISQVLGSLSRTQKDQAGKVSQLGMLKLIEETVGRSMEMLGLIVAKARDSQEHAMELGQRHFARKMANELALYGSENELAVLEARGEQSRLRRLMAKKIQHLPVAFEPPPAAGDEAALQASFNRAWESWGQAGERLLRLGQVETYLQEARGPIVEYQSLQKAFASFKRTVEEKSRRRKSVEAIQRHLIRLRADGERLHDVIIEQMLPSFRTLCGKFLIPIAQQVLNDFTRAFRFVRDVEKLSFENLQRDFLDRAVFRRFHASQFRTGAFYGQNPDHPLFAHLSNVLPALYLFHRQVRHNLRKFGFANDDIVLTKLPLAQPAEIKRYCERQRELEPRKRHTYLVLPGTLSLREALDIIEHKERLFDGIPQLILIFISKYDEGEIRSDATLRKRFFRAVSHNVILNIGGTDVVDNPAPISQQLVRATVGSSFDLERIDLVSDSEVTAKSAPA